MPQNSISKHFISESDLKNKCWWCSELITGFDITKGRERKSYMEHYCNKKCHDAAQDFLKEHEKQTNLETLVVSS